MRPCWVLRWSEGTCWDSTHSWAACVCVRQDRLQHAGAARRAHCMRHARGGHETSTHVSPGWRASCCCGCADTTCPIRAAVCSQIVLLGRLCLHVPMHNVAPLLHSHSAPTHLSEVCQQCKAAVPRDTQPGALAQSVPAGQQTRLVRPKMRWLRGPADQEGEGVACAASAYACVGLSTTQTQLLRTHSA